jgi:hypothetical protein
VSWCQLTYASAGSGWDVQEVTPGTPPALEAQMRAGVTTRLELLDHLADFPSTAELGTRTRRLAFRFDDDGGSVWWHAVEAGKDATGRPGNVFTHAVGTSGLSRTLRPIDLWPSTRWLAPFGPREVAETVLGEFDPVPASGRSAAIERALSRQEHTEALLAAASACRDRGSSLVLASKAQSEFVLWLSVLSHLTAAPVAAGSFSFSTFERAARLQGALESYTVVFIPTADLAQAHDLAAAQAPAMIVLDLDNLPVAPSGGEWEYAGQRWPAEGLWQDAFFELTDAGRYGRADVDRILTRMDDLADGGDDYRDAGSPLALALLDDLDDEPRHRHLLSQWGAHLDPDRRLADRVGTPTLGHGPADSAETAPSGPSRGVRLTVCLPEAEAATPTHARLARALLGSADVLASEPDPVADVERWLMDYEQAQAATSRRDDLDTETE